MVALSIRMVALSIHMVALSIHMVALSIRMVALSFRMVALSIRIRMVAFSIHMVALSIRMVAFSIHMVALSVRMVALSIRMVALSIRMSTIHLSYRPREQPCLDGGTLRRVAIDWSHSLSRFSYLRLHLEASSSCWTFELQVDQNARIHIVEDTEQQTSRAKLSVSASMSNRTNHLRHNENDSSLRDTVYPRHHLDGSQVERAFSQGLPADMWQT
eukprot:1188796-Prorocentrum_minimum.AAC.6